MPNSYGRQVVEPLVNKSGGGVIAGDVVVIDTTNDTAFTTTTTGRAEITVGIAQETIASNATGRVLLSGYAALVNVPASVTRGHFVETYTVVKQATGNSTRRSGSFGQFRTGGTTPTAVIWGSTDPTGTAASGSITASGYTQTTARLLGRTTASTGAIEEITVGSGLTLSAGSITASGGSGAMTLITDTLLGSDTPTIDFTSIAGTYKHLLIIFNGRSDRAASTEDGVKMRFNNDSGSNYSSQQAQFFNASTGAQENIATTSFVTVADVPAASSAAGYNGTARIDIPNYAATTFNKGYMSQCMAHLDTGSSNTRVWIAAGEWMSTVAITRVTLSPVNGSNFKTGSRASLYGIS